MAEEISVYLDHLIPRENLRYRRSDEYYNKQPEARLLALSDLFDRNLASRLKLLRKPDFQRATWSWSPQDCVSLLDSIINEQVIPTVIMWLSPDNNYYVLDGAHRISVALAWLQDDWGDKLPDDLLIDSDLKNKILKAANDTRRLVKASVGSFNDYVEADKESDRVSEEGEAPKLVLDKLTYKRATFYKKFLGGNVGFHLLWVPGDHEKAEQSFVKINKSGRQLSPWETNLVENRNSSFARAVMSIVNVSSAKYYWPEKESGLAPELLSKATSIIEGVGKLHDILFNPPYHSSRTISNYPLLVAPDIPKKPFYVAELLTVIEGGKGRDAETDKLLALGKNAEPAEIVNSGFELINSALSVFEHLIGSSVHSLGISPKLYFYTGDGRYVRSLLYGLIYWLFSGNNEKSLKDRKLLFSSYRSAFEQVLLDNKEDIVSRITRKTGSGPDVTAQTALYYQDLIELLIKHNGDTHTPAFRDDYSKKLLERKLRPTSSKTRSLLPNSSKKVLNNLFEVTNKCNICEGLVGKVTDLGTDSHLFTQNKISTVVTSLAVHPFCIENQTTILNLRGKVESLSLPVYVDPELIPGAKQLSFFDLEKFDPIPM